MDVNERASNSTCMGQHILVGRGGIDQNFERLGEKCCSWRLLRWNNRSSPAALSLSHSNFPSHLPPPPIRVTTFQLAHGLGTNLCRLFVVLYLSFEVPDYIHPSRGPTSVLLARPQNGPSFVVYAAPRLWIIAPSPPRGSTRHRNTRLLNVNACPRRVLSLSLSFARSRLDYDLWSIVFSPSTVQDPAAAT